MQMQMVVTGYERWAMFVGGTEEVEEVLML
jgi:hypothetical protein